MSDNLVEISLSSIQLENGEDTNMTEGKYLDLANTMKEIVEEKDQELKREKRKKEFLQRKLLRCYGIIHMVYEIVGELDLGMYNDTIEHNIEYALDQVKEGLEIEEYSK
jgi:hypothetical protein